MLLSAASGAANWHPPQRQEKTGAGDAPHLHPPNSQRGQSITAAGSITGLLQVHGISSVNCESDILLFIQWKLNKIAAQKKKKARKDTKLLQCISLEIGGGSDFSSSHRKFRNFQIS